MYIVIATTNVFVNGPRPSQTDGVIASSPTIRSNGSSTRSISVTVESGLDAGQYYVIGVLDWTQHFPNGSTGNGQDQPLIGLVDVSNRPD